jgi:hypothetical protein
MTSGVKFKSKKPALERSCKLDSLFHNVDENAVLENRARAEKPSAETPWPATRIRALPVDATLLTDKINAAHAQ